MDKQKKKSYILQYIFFVCARIKLLLHDYDIEKKNLFPLFYPLGSHAVPPKINCQPELAGNCEVKDL